MYHRPRGMPCRTTATHGRIQHSPGAGQPQLSRVFRIGNRAVLGGLFHPSTTANTNVVSRIHSGSRMSNKNKADLQSKPRSSRRVSAATFHSSVIETRSEREADRDAIREVNRAAFHD